MANQQNVKKVKAYPIPVSFQIGTTPVTGNIVKLTQQGFLAEVGLATLQPGEKFDCKFELPVLHRIVTSGGVMVKLYNHWAGKSTEAGAESGGPTPAPSPGTTANPKVMRLIEYHFQNLSSENKSSIQMFLKALGKGAN